MGQEKATYSKRFTFVAAVSIAILSALIFLVIIQQKNIVSTLDSWGVLPRPERLSELYFTDYDRLPTTYTADEPYVVEFAIRNLEHQTTNYQYRVVQTGENGSNPQQLAAGQLRLDHDIARTVAAPIIYHDGDPRSHILVIIEYDSIAPGDTSPTLDSQQISYWVTRK